MSPGLFEPEDQKQLEDLITKNVPIIKNWSDEILLVGAEDSLFAYGALDDEPIEVLNRDAGFYDVCVHDGNLYAADGDGRIFNVFSGSNHGKRDNSVNALCSHQGKLYDGGSYGVYETFPNRQILQDQYASMVSHEGNFYAADFKGIVIDVFYKRSMVIREERVRNFLSYGGKVYDCGDSGLYVGLKSGTPFINDEIYNVLGFGGEIFCLDNFDFVHPVGSKEILELKGLNLRGIDCIRSVPKEVVEGLL